MPKHKKPKGIEPHNLGVDWIRTTYGKAFGANLERVFMQEWNRVNSRKNDGVAFAEILMAVPEEHAEEFDGPSRDDQTLFGRMLNKEVMIYNLTEREHRIIATIIQWLGTNIGFAFLQSALDKAGYRIETKKRVSAADPIPKLNSRYEILIQEERDK